MPSGREKVGVVYDYPRLTVGAIVAYGEMLAPQIHIVELEPTIAFRADAARHGDLSDLVRDGDAVVYGGITVPVLADGSDTPGGQIGQSVVPVVVRP